MNKWVKPIIAGLLSLVFLEACSSSMESSGQVTLNPGDNFQQANDNFPGGTVFLVRAGVHSKQRVHNPKNGNVWLGEGGAILDGDNYISAAFTGNAENVTIQGIEIKNYVDNGIFFDSGSNVILKRLTISDSGSGNGELNGAIRLNDVQQIHISHSFFTRVSAGILPTSCTGPVNIEWNTGINIGRNFIQLDKCEGEGIRVQYNTMERIDELLRPGANDVIDWISIFRSNGTEQDPIRIMHNRARGHGYSDTGSFIMLGDEGGSYQIAEGNVGVTPGQVGIGIAGGDYITVNKNILFSEEWEDSNVAFYSANFSSPVPCSNHTISNNRSFWYYNDGQQNNIWTDQRCDAVLLNNRYPDKSLNHNIWESSKAANIKTGN